MQQQQRRTEEGGSSSSSESAKKQYRFPAIQLNGMEVTPSDESLMLSESNRNAVVAACAGEGGRRRVQQQRLPPCNTADKAMDRMMAARVALK